LVGLLVGAVSYLVRAVGWLVDWLVSYLVREVGWLVI
jgi:hypothetical protein